MATALIQDITENGMGQGDLVKLLGNVRDLVNELQDDHATFRTVVADSKALANQLRLQALYNVMGNPGFANKVHGIRAARCCTEEDAKMSRAHNDANVMSLGGRMLEPELAKKMADIFLATDFEGGRHQKRIDDLEPAL